MGKMKFFSVFVCFASVLSLNGCRRSGEEVSAPPVLPSEPEEERLQVNGPEQESPKFMAIFRTSMGDISCELFPDRAPVTIDNFVSLARGTRKWVDPETGNEVERPLYTGTVFHRVIPEFMVQGGDPLGTGFGGPGYMFEDEICDTLRFDRPGILAMANAGPNTNGSQFFITVAPTPWLNGRHTIFGRVVSGQEIVESISRVERDQHDRPLTPVVLKEVEIVEK